MESPYTNVLASDDGGAGRVVAAATVRGFSNVVPALTPGNGDAAVLAAVAVVYGLQAAVVVLSGKRSRFSPLINCGWGGDGESSSGLSPLLSIISRAMVSICVGRGDEDGAAARSSVVLRGWERGVGTTWDDDVDDDVTA